MTAPDRICIHVAGYEGRAQYDPCWHMPQGDEYEVGYIRHDAAALAASPLVQDMIRQAVEAEREALGITKPLAAELLQWIDDELAHWPAGTAYADDLARFAAAIRARKGE